MTWKEMLAGAIALLGLGGVPAAKSWAVYYGPPPEPGAPPPTGFDLVVLEPDHPWQPRAKAPGQTVLAYLSLGEVHKTRKYWPLLAAQTDAQAGPNPDWPGAIRMDPRAKAWRAMILDEVAPAILAKGYDGFFFDTLDVGGWLEGRGKHPGARQAMAYLVNDIKRLHPDAQLYANGGLDLLPETAPALAGIVTESVFTDYDFAAKAYRRRDDAGSAERVQTMAKARKDARLPIYVIEYADPEQAALRAELAGLNRAQGFVPFVADIGLTRLDPTP